jgi:hypothetical protein
MDEVGGVNLRKQIQWQTKNLFAFIGGFSILLILVNQLIINQLINCNQYFFPFSDDICCRY